jgi:hypothetical protein
MAARAGAGGLRAGARRRSAALGAFAALGPLALGLLALGALALGSGCDDEDDDQRLGPVTGGSGSSGLAGASSGAGAAADAGGTAVSEPIPGAGAAPSTAPAGAGGQAGELEGDLLATSAISILTRDCGACHAGSERAGGVGDIGDIDALISSRSIIPGASELSPLLDSIRAGRMPPADSRTRPSVGEQWLIEGFIDGLSEHEGCEPPPLPSVDEAYAAMLADALSQPDADRPFIRYVSLADIAAEVCGRPLQERRLALFQALNGTSLDPEIHVPVPIDPYERLYRIDVRNYDWDRSLDLAADGSDDHPDAWLALVAAAGPYAVEMRGPEADALLAATGAGVPVLPSSVLVWAASSGDLYYALIDAQANIFDTQLALGVDWEANWLDGGVRLAAFFGHVSSESTYQREFLVARQPQSVSNRGYWSRSQQQECDSESIYDTVLDDEREAGQTIWQLPNGLLAYSVEDQVGVRLTAPTDPSSCIECCDNTDALYPMGGNPAGCHACHHRGLAPVRDEVLAVLEEGFQPWPAETAQVYSASDLDAQMAADNAVYIDALARMGVIPAMPSPLSRVFLSFERAPLDLGRAAAELGTTPAALRESLPRLPSSFAPLAESGGSISRRVMTEGQTAARCVLSEAARNRPFDCPLGS